MFLLAAALALVPLNSFAAPAKITVEVAKPAHPISPTLWGIFFEDINLSADGGIYPELVRNRSFEDADTPESWQFASADGKSSANMVKPDYTAKPAIVPLNPLNQKSLRIRAGGVFTLENAGYWGMNFVKGDGYTLKLAARVEGGFAAPLTAKLVTTDGSKTLASGELKGFTGNWAYHTLDLTPGDTDAKGKLVLSAEGKGTLVLDMISLMPKKTWKDHGLRPDLAESIDALKPAFLRFPGGCWVEGETMDKMYQWKKTIGDVDARTPLWNIWKYFATHGLGYHEYLQMAEDLGAEPLFDINCGMSHKETIPMSQMGQWVQDALDAIEYANGPTNSYWGGLRAEAGHPAPFNLKYLEIGNENGGEAYRERWALMHKVIKEKHPEMQLIANHWQGGYPSTPRADIVDEHFYHSPEWFMRHANYFDQYDRTGSKIFVGEYAVTEDCGKGNLRGAIGEAAFMTGLERNSDHVIMACYAPLLVNLNHRAWNPDLINFDSANWYGLPSYYVQKMFADNRGDVYLPTAVESPMTEETVTSGMIGVGTWNTAAEFKDVKVTAPDGRVLLQSDFSKSADGWKLLGDGGDWKVQDGALRQGAEKEFIRALAGEMTWTNYTVTLKARKMSGEEGFLILFHIANDEGRLWWNLGGWGNTDDSIEAAGGRIDSKRGHVEIGRWYDLKLTVSGRNVKCWLDGKMVHNLDYESGGRVTALYASAARDEKSSDIIVKVVNANAAALEADVVLNGMNLTGQGTALALTSENATDENSLADPMKVSPKSEPVTFGGNTIKHSFPGNSFTVLRLNTK